ncbi:hypothetical protein, partial [Ferrimicrobium acidiphilum]
EQRRRFSPPLCWPGVHRGGDGDNPHPLRRSCVPYPGIDLAGAVSIPWVDKARRWVKGYVG